MIKKIRHKGLYRYYAYGDRSGINAGHAERINLILSVLDAVSHPKQAALPGWRLHPLTGSRSGFWSIRVSRNWRVTFRFDGEDVTDLNYEDYH